MNPTRGLVADTIPFSCVDGPGNRFVVFLQGCNFDCIACHNPSTITTSAASAGATWTSVDTLVERIRPVAPFLSGVTVSGGEATLQAQFVAELFDALQADPQLGRLSRFIDSNGSTTAATWTSLAPVTDGVMIDLKCLDPAIHFELTRRPNGPVLASIEQLSGLGLLWEVRLLLVAGINDDPKLLRRTAAWLANVDPAMRVKLIAFRPHGVRDHSPSLVQPTDEEMRTAADVMAAAAPFQICTI